MKVAEGPQRGKRGKIIASRNRSGQYQREASPHKNHRTPAQKRVRVTMSDLVHLWNQITEAQRAAWRVLAREVHSRPWMGKFGKLDGPLLFKKLNTVLATCERDLLLDPPPLPKFGPNPVTGFEITEGAEGPVLKLKLREAPLADLMVYAWAPVNPGVEQNSNYAFLGLAPAAVDGVIEITALYLKKLNEWRKLKNRRYQVPLAGAKVFVRVWQQANGWEHVLGMFVASAFVPAKRAAGGRPAGTRARRH